MKTKTWTVYLLTCSDGTLYCGATSNLQKRVETHNKGKGAKYTRGRLPVVLRASRGGLTRSEALRLEHMVKKQPKCNKAGFLKSFRIEAKWHTMTWKLPEKEPAELSRYVTKETTDGENIS